MENKKDDKPKSMQELFGLTDDQLKCLKEGMINEKKELKDEDLRVVNRLLLKRITQRPGDDNASPGFRYNLLNPDEFNRHLTIIKNIGDETLCREGRRFIIDDGNFKVIKFLLLYFHDHRECEEVFPEMNHVLEKNLLIVGQAGTGKTVMMEIFSKYLGMIKSRHYFRNTSMIRLMNYYKVHSHINQLTFNESKETGKCNPFALCLNDIGLEVESQKSYGTDIRDVVDEFLFARYEIYQQYYIRTHLTSNYDVEDFKNRFNYRINDRFKSYNIVPLTGNSRRG